MSTDITVSVAGGGASVTVTGNAAAADVAVSGATAAVSVTQMGGDRGPKGDTGPANTLAIGTVTTGAAGSNASATLTGTAPNQTLSLVLPAGQNGSSGANGTFADAQVVNDRTASYTLAISDAGKLIAASHASTAITITVPAGSAVAFPVGTHVDIARLGVAQVTVVGASGVTVNGTPGLKLRAQYSAATLIEVAADSWLLVGDLSA